MAHHDRKALAGLSQMHSDTIGLDESMDELRHKGASWCAEIEILPD
jgi:hypothetical protein